MPALKHDLFNENCVKARKVQANYYKDVSGAQRKELLITLQIPTSLPRLVTASAANCYFRGEGESATLKVPIYEEELKYFYSNYKDYYYLPTEDVALHKSVAGFVDKEHRLQASAANCYPRKFSCYLPQWEILFTPFFNSVIIKLSVSYSVTQMWQRHLICTFILISIKRNGVLTV